MTRSKRDAPETTLPIACNVDRIPADERDVWLATASQFYQAVTECREESDGYALRVAAHDLRLTAEYVHRDRWCCAFLSWEIVVEPGGGPVWLRLRGPEGTKQFLKQAFEMTALLPTSVAHAAGFATAERAPVELASAAEFAKKLAR